MIDTNPYDGFEYGVYLNQYGELVASDAYCVSGFIPIPMPSSRWYCCFDAGEARNLECMCVYNKDFQFIGFWAARYRYRTIEFTRQDIAYVRVSMLKTAKYTSFVRVIDKNNMLNHITVWHGASPQSDYYRNVAMGVLQNNTSAASNTLTYRDGVCIVGSDPIRIPGNCTSITFSRAGAFLMFDENKQYSNWWGQNSDPRTVTDSRFTTLWRYFRLGQVDTARLDNGAYVYDNTNGVYLFKGRDFV